MLTAVLETLMTEEACSAAIATSHSSIVLMRPGQSASTIVFVYDFL
jgi:hypothetical protein